MQHSLDQNQLLPDPIEAAVRKLAAPQAAEGTATDGQADSEEDEATKCSANRGATCGTR